MSNVSPAGASLQLVPIIPRACSSIINLQYSITLSTCQAVQNKLIDINKLKLYEILFIYIVIEFFVLL